MTKRAARGTTSRRRPADDAAPSRRRRTPEEAREAILAAADRLFAAHGPEGVGLVDIAREVGVTHGLVTHYFGTFAGLVREVFARRNRLAAATVLEQIAAARERGDAVELQRFAIAYVCDEPRARLFLWLRFHDPGPRQGHDAGAPLLRALVDVLEREIAAFTAGPPPLTRDAIELLVLLTLAAGHGWAIGRHVWLRGLGRADGPEVDAAFQDLLLRALTACAAALGEPRS